jgi:thiamine pyrophosphate-dependent acetolactate synthase large subunit-like protein
MENKTMMTELDAQNVISQHRGSAIIVSPSELPMSTNYELDMSYSCTSKASSLGLGLALARPERKIMILEGDGALLMNLGSLMTIANMAPPNLIHFVIQNEVYLTTRGHPISVTSKLNFVLVARGAGYPNVYDLEDIESFKSSIKTIINQAGPTFVCIKCLPLRERLHTLRGTKEDLRERCRALRELLIRP